MDNSKKFWNRFARVYDFIIKKDKNAYDQVIAKIQTELNTEMNVLEIATGTGLMAVQLAPFCKHFEATDFSEEMIKTAKLKNKIQNLSFTMADATKLSYGDNAFDVVIISNALHIMPDPALVLSNIKRVLKKDGILIAPTFMRSTNIFEQMHELPMKIVGFKTFSKWTFEEYIQFLEKNDWKVIKSNCIKASFPLAYVTAKMKD